MSETIYKLLDCRDEELIKGRIGLFCNHTSYNFRDREYLYQTLAARGNFLRVFLPEHGLFSELQDQIPLEKANYGLSDNASNLEFVSLYGKTEKSLEPRMDQIVDLDALVLDIQDLGCRYYTYGTTIYYLLRAVSKIHPQIKIYIPDRINPCGRNVEGTRLPPQYSSFVGVPGLIHRYGLTTGELCRYFLSVLDSNLSLTVFPLDSDSLHTMTLNKSFIRSTFSIAPSPNMPNFTTAQIYSGQCLLEGTNISEGRGTTRPFEIFGSPYIKSLNYKKNPPVQKNSILRPLKYIPVFHKYANEICEGWQIHITDPDYHSLSHSLKIIRYIKEEWSDYFDFRRGIYEFLSDKSAIQILLGDDRMLSFLNGKTDFKEIRERLSEEEDAWIKEVDSILLYRDIPLMRVHLDSAEDFF